MPIEAVILDLDGVLVDSFKAWYHAERQIFQKYLKRDISEEEHRKDIWGKDVTETCKLLGLSAEETKKVAQWQDMEIEKHLDKIKIFPSATETLQTLKEMDLKLALLSNNRKHLIDKILGKFGLERFFDVIVGDEIEPKPSPEGLLKIIYLLKIDKSRALFVGDTETDSETGRAAGIKTVIVGKDIRTLEELPAFVNWHEIRYF